MASSTERSAPEGGARAGLRLESVDVLRGAIMVVMVLDHVRDFLGNPGIDPTDLDRTTPALFLTRWITHFCAPVFVLLAGVGAGLAGLNGKSRNELARFLLIRGLWLIVLEQTWISVMLFFALPKVILAIILWAIGWSMIALAGLIYLPRAAVGGIGVGLIALHNLADGVQVAGAGATAILWRVLHQPGVVPLPGGFLLMALYPLIPWVGVMAAGYALAPVLLRPPASRRNVLFALGLALTAGFVLLRASNAYGDPRPWSARPDPTSTLLSLLNCQKYPPSLLFLMMTLGPALLALGWLDLGMGPARLRDPLRTLGRVPLFYYLLQWPLIHGLAVLLAALRGQPTAWLFGFPPFQAPADYGSGLPFIYLWWAIVVALLYWPSRWFAGLKRRRRDAWLGYF